MTLHAVFENINVYLDLRIDDVPFVPDPNTSSCQSVELTPKHDTNFFHSLIFHVIPLEDIEINLQNSVKITPALSGVPLVQFHGPLTP